MGKVGCFGAMSLLLWRSFSDVSELVFGVLYRLRSLGSYFSIVLENLMYIPFIADQYYVFDLSTKTALTNMLE